MPPFRYVAVDSAGQTQRGVMEAPDQAAVIERLQRQGHIPMRAEPAGQRGFLDELFSIELGRRRGLTKSDVAGVTRELAIMLGAGQDLDRALRFLVDTAPNKRVANIMGQVRDKVRGGSALAAALALQPQSFNRLYVGLVRAGEAGGTLGDTLERLALLLERQRSLAATIKSAMIYPVLLLIASIGSIALLLTYVLPQFVPLFEESGAQLPHRDPDRHGCRRFHHQLWALGAGLCWCCWCSHSGNGCKTRHAACPSTGCCCACRSLARWCARSWPRASPGPSAPCSRTACR